MNRVFLCLMICLVFSLSALAQDPTPAPTTVAQPQTGGGFPGLPGREPEIRPYERVITKDAKSDDGLFTVHRIKDKIYYEIPKNQLNKEFLWVTQIAKTTNGVGYGGQALGSRVVRWERRDNRVLLRNVNYSVVADPAQPIARAVKAANNDAIIMSFFIEAIGKDEAPVIDVSRLFTSEVTELTAKARLRARIFDASRSFIERVASYPENIEAEATHTFSNPADAAAAGPAAPPNPFAGAGMGTGSASIVMHFSMVKLPENPMKPRLFDERVGYFSVNQMDYSVDEHRAPKRTYITRWRLEKKDPTAAVSEPVKPIVYYIDAATPTKLVPYIKRGVEQWQVAFEAAGFKNAIIAKEQPKDDPDFSPEDARYSVIRWLPSTIENASGPHIHDPRTGEILESDIQMYHNIMNLQRSWYFTQVGPLDPRVKKLPMPDDLMGELVEYVVAHEVGHTLGFQHNMKASSTYPAEKVRDKEWVKKMGHTPTLMDYSRFNYVAQPEDGIALKDLIPGIGPYDKWATKWGYAEMRDCRTADDEKKTLDEWAREQDKTPWLRFSTANSRGADPGDQTEAVGDSDAIYATTYGLKNLKRVSDMLLTAATTPGEPYEDLQELYTRMLGQWATELRHVVPIVGGMNSQQKHGGQDGVLFTIVPKDRQSAAVKFLNENAFATPTWALKPDILRRIEANGALDRVKNLQSGILSSLLSNVRLARMTEHEAIDGVTAYRPVDLLADVRKGVFAELDATTGVKIDAYRRNLQRAYLDNLAEKLNGRAPVTDDTRGLVRSELRTLSADVTKALAKTTDRTTRAHLDDVKDQIAKILDPKFVPPAPASPLTTLFGRGFEDDLAAGCWEDVMFEFINKR